MRIIIICTCLIISSCSTHTKKNDSNSIPLEVNNSQEKLSQEDYVREIDIGYMKLITESKSRYLSLYDDLNKNLAEQKKGTFFSNFSLKAQEKLIRENLEDTHSHLFELIKLYEGVRRVNELIEGKYQDPESIYSYQNSKMPPNICIKFQKKFGWSKNYSVTGKIISGSDLNSATGSLGRFETLATYIVVFWDDDKASIFKLPFTSFGKIPMFETEVVDQKGIKWKIKKYDSLCY